MIPLAEETSFDYETVRELAALPALMERAALLRERGPNLFLIPERYLAAVQRGTRFTAAAAEQSGAR